MTHSIKQTGHKMAAKAMDAASVVAMAAIKEWWERHVPPSGIKSKKPFTDKKRKVSSSDRESGKKKKKPFTKKPYKHHKKK